MKITVTRAITELKNIKSRIAEKVNETNFFGVQRGTKLTYPSSSIKPEDFEKDVRERVQSIETLLKRAQEIKFAIDKSNNITKIKIGEEEVTVAEVLAMKSLIELKRNLYTRVQLSLRMATAKMEDAERENQEKIKEMTNLLINRDSKEKEKESALKKSTEDVEKQYPISLLDPAKCQDKMKVLDEELELFKKELDYVLSESNATTLIEISD